MSRVWLVSYLLVFCMGTAWAQTAEEAKALNAKLVQLYREGRYTEAIPVGEKALAICEQALGPESPYTATSLNNLAELYKAMGEYQQALPLYQRALAICERALGPEHLRTAISLNNLAGLYEAMGDYELALPLYQRTLAIREEARGPEHPETGTSLNDLAGLYKSMGDYELALPLYQRALAIWEEAIGPEHPDTATILNNLASLYSSMGGYEQALPLYRRALATRELALGPEHPDTARSLNNLALLYSSMGDYKLALPLYQRALAIREKALGPEHPDSAISLNNLALLYQSMGDFQQALPLYQRALTICENALGPEHRDTATSLNNLAGLYCSMGDYKQALALYKRALAIREKALGPEHPYTATSFNNLAGLYRLMGDYEQALALYKRAVTIWEEALGPEHPDTATSLNNLAGLYNLMGGYEQALPLFQRALAIREKALGPENPDTAASLNNLAYLHIDLDASSSALKLAGRGATATLATTANIFTFASERQRLAYQEQQHPFDLFGTLASAPNLIHQALRYKGLVLDSVVEDLRLAEVSDDPTTRDLAAKVKTVKRELNRLAFDRPTNLSAEARQQRREREKELKTQLEQLQGTLARAGTKQGTLRRAFTITPEQVQDALPPDSTLVEFLRYSHYLGKDKWETRYGAVILPKSGEAIWAPLPGKAEDLETQITAYKSLVRGQKVPGRFSLADNSATGDGVDASLLLKELYSGIWAPVEKRLPAGTKTVVISPDGELNFVSLATLITPRNRFLAEDYNLTYVSSGRDLVAENGASSNQTHLLVGDPNFGGKVEGGADSSSLSRAVDTRDWKEMNFAQLPYTLVECKSLEEFYHRKNEKVVILLNGSATEAGVRQVQAPETLHLATHGYFLPEPEANRKAREMAYRPGAQELDLPLKDPMFRSGLALAGAQTTVNLRARGENPDMKNDGLLTAAEVGVLNLNGTRLVTLSACDTGSGESRAGEGVLGLRRGFIQAGARNLILTLWPVADKETSDLMQEFYARAEEQPAPLAMADVQREWLTRLRGEKSLSEAVRLAGPFVLSFQGRIE